MVQHLPLGLGRSTPQVPPRGSPDSHSSKTVPSAHDKLELGSGLMTDWLGGCRRGRRMEDGRVGGMGGVVRLGLRCSADRHAYTVHIALRTSPKIHVQMNVSLNKDKPQSAGKSGKLIESRGHKSGPIPSARALWKPVLPHKQYSPPPGPTRRKQASDRSQRAS